MKERHDELPYNSYKITNVKYKKKNIIVCKKSSTDTTTVGDEYILKELKPDENEYRIFNINKFSIMRNKKNI